MTRLRKMMLEELQARKSLRLCLAGLRVRWFDPKVPDYPPGAKSFRLFGDSWAPFLVSNSLMQDQPDQPTLSMGMAPMA